MGDLNTLSPLDAPEHEAAALAERLGLDDGLRRKFLKPAFVILVQAGFIIIDENAGGNMHGVNEA